MLKLLVYGYAYGHRSSRKLEQACHHNLSFIWLMGGLTPDYRTIARFRNQYKEAIKNVLKQCVRMCLKLDLIDGNSLFIDGSGFRANASIKHSWTKERCEKDLKRIDKRIDELLEQAEDIDQKESEEKSLVKIKNQIKDKEQLKQKISSILKELSDTQVNSLNTTDEDSIKIKSRQGIHAGYNVQMVTDKKYGLIVTAEASQSSSDANQLSDQIIKASENLGEQPCRVSADAGYYSLEDIAKVSSKITVIVPSPQEVHQERTHQEPARFDKERFVYDEDTDRYVCPKGRYLRYIRSCNDGRRQYQTTAGACMNCSKFGECTSNIKGRMITRSKEEVLKNRLHELYRSRQGQKTYRLRQQKAELPFGHLKRNLSVGHFLLRKKKGADCEVSILSTCFNITRMITILKIPNLLNLFKLCVT
jgi:hypothetical protein